MVLSINSPLVHSTFFLGAILIFISGLYLAKKLKPLLFKDPSLTKSYLYSVSWTARLFGVLISIAYFLLYIKPIDIIDFIFSLILIAISTPLLLLGSSINSAFVNLYPFDVPILTLLGLLSGILVSSLLATIPAYLVSKKSKSTKRLLIWQIICVILYIILAFAIVAIFFGFDSS